MEDQVDTIQREDHGFDPAREFLEYTDISKRLIDDILNRTNMNLAWEKVLSNKGAPGIDQVTLHRWNSHWEENLERLSRQVRSNTYHANPPRRIQIQKPNGGIRELSMLTISDRVLQRAVLNIVEPIFDKRFLNCSHGYRPRRSVATAVQQVLNYRDGGLRWLVDADIKECFYSIDHSILQGLIKRVVRDWHVNNLMGLWLKAGRKQKSSPVGIPMGGVISPLWCNIYLHQMDARLSCSGVKMVRYADDFVCMTSTREKAEELLEKIGSVLSAFKLDLSQEKTRISSFSNGFTFLGVDFLGNNYQYVHRNKKITIENRNLRTLYAYPPSFY